MVIPVVVGVPPIRPTQAYVPACIAVHCDLTPGFHLTKFARVILYLSRTDWHVAPVATLWNLLQFFTMPV